MGTLCSYQPTIFCLYMFFFLISYSKVANVPIEGLVSLNYPVWSAELSCKRSYFPLSQFFFHECRLIHIAYKILSLSSIYQALWTWISATMECVDQVGYRCLFLLLHLHATGTYLRNYTCEINNYTALSYSFVHHEVGIPGHSLLVFYLQSSLVECYYLSGFLRALTKAVGRRMVGPDPSVVI